MQLAELSILWRELIYRRAEKAAETVSKKLPNKFPLEFIIFDKTSLAPPFLNIAVVPLKSGLTIDNPLNNTIWIGNFLLMSEIEESMIMSEFPSFPNFTSISLSSTARDFRTFLCCYIATSHVILVDSVLHLCELDFLFSSISFEYCLHIPLKGLLLTFKR